MPHHNYISRNIFVSILAIAFLLASTFTVSAQDGTPGFCCDPDGTEFAVHFSTCQTFPAFPEYTSDGCVEDQNCSNFDPNAPCVIIPIEDGIPLLIIAGGVFAFYRLREKKELVVIEA